MLNATLVLFYGPPAVGKLTVAEQLSIQTGMTLFSNHDTIAFARKYFEYASAGFFKVVDATRTIVLTELIKEGRSAIFTFAYSGSAGDTEFLSSLAEEVSSAGGQVMFVRLSCSTNSLLKRVSDPRRQALGKLTDPVKLLQSLRRFQYDTVFPCAPSLHFDTDALSPQSIVNALLDLHPIGSTQ